MVEALMTEILQAPDEDGPRLVYADWLEQQGDPRGEFIRLQCLLAAEGEQPELAARAAALLEQHGERWVIPLDAVDAAPGFIRGLLSYVYCTTGAFMKKAAQKAMRAHLPKLGAEQIIIRGTTKKVAALAASEAFRWTHGLRWWNTQLSDAGLAEFARAPTLQNIRSLTLEKLRCGDAGLQALANSSALPRLRRLSLQKPVHGGQMTSSGVLTLLRSEHLHIEDLEVTVAYRVRSAELAEGSAEDFARLRRLRLELGDDFTPLATSRHLSGLRHLSLDSFARSFTDENLSAFLDNPAYAQLETFSYKQPAHYPAIASGVQARLRSRFGAAVE